MMKIGYAIERDILSKKPPAERAWLSVMKRVERVRKMGDVPGARLNCEIKGFEIGLRMPNEDPNPTANQLASHVYTAMHFGRERHQSGIRGRGLPTEKIDRARVAFIRSKMLAIERAAAIFVNEGAFKVNSQNARACRRVILVLYLDPGFYR
jgi:hypothetical protein